MSDAKDVEVKARVSKKTRQQLEAIADERDESLSLIVREAVGEYIAKRKGTGGAAKKRSSR